MNPAIELAFEHNYNIEHVEFTSGMPVKNQFYFPGATTIGGRDGVHLKLEPLVGEVWLGVFSFGEGGVTGVFSSPNPNVVCVASYGNTFLVNARNPKEYETVSCVTSQIFQLPKLKILLTVDVAGVKAFGEHGLLWTTNEFNDPIVETITENEVKGTCEDCGRPMKFSIDITSGDIISLERQIED